MNGDTRGRKCDFSGEVGKSRRADEGNCRALVGVPFVVHPPKPPCTFGWTDAA
jgi:hypothetical protein